MLTLVLRKIASGAVVLYIFEVTSGAICCDYSEISHVTEEQICIHAHIIRLAVFFLIFGTQNFALCLQPTFSVDNIGINLKVC